jgi:membrane-bound lytic murein transglycosylase B
LYQLLGVTNDITFGEAVKIAQWASAQSGVRPAFLLAVLTQESNLGKNVGTCNRPGDPPSKSWKVVMNPTRDQPPFLQITQELGMDTDITPISCPMRDSRGRQIGWGGAMGPAQFIPSTWMGYRDKVSAITGKTADPWDIRDAFLAAAIKLAAGGATTQSGEWTAAMRYFSGSTSTKYRFYGDSVVAQAAKYQSDIDELNNN